MTISREKFLELFVKADFNDEDFSFWANYPDIIVKFAQKLKISRQQIEVLINDQLRALFLAPSPNNQAERSIVEKDALVDDSKVQDDDEPEVPTTSTGSGSSNKVVGDSAISSDAHSAMSSQPNGQAQREPVVEDHESIEVVGRASQDDESEEEKLEDLDAFLPDLKEIVKAKLTVSRMNIAKIVRTLIADGEDVTATLVAERIGASRKEIIAFCKLHELIENQECVNGRWIYYIRSMSRRSNNSLKLDKVKKEIAKMRKDNPKSKTINTEQAARNLGVSSSALRVFFRRHKKHFKNI